MADFQSPPVHGQQYGSDDVAPTTITPEQLAQIVLGYKGEAEAGRFQREQVWKAQWDLYWQRIDLSDKAPWQSDAVMPYGPQFVERFAAALRKALVQAGEWYTITAPEGMFTELAPTVRAIVDYWLCQAGATATRGPVGFPTLFEDMLRVAAISKAEIAVTARTIKSIEPRMLTEETTPELDMPMSEPTYTRRVVQVKVERPVVDIEVVDPMFVWRDPTGRGLYRWRRTEVDLHELMAMAEERDDEGNDIWDVEAIRNLASQVDTETERQRQRKSGDTSSVVSTRKPILLDEWLGTFVDHEGKIVAENALVVTANERVVVRGPEPNPYWHGKDWIVDGAVMRVHGAPYGKSYMESWSDLARAFTETTNLILDATYTGSMKAFAGDATVLEDPQQLREGISPNKFFQLEEGRRMEEFIGEIDLGRLPQESLDVWRGIKDLLQEGAMQNDIMLGSIPTKSDVKATEVMQAQESTNAFVQSMADNIQLSILDPLLDLVWKTALQIWDLGKNPGLREALGDKALLLEGKTPEEMLELFSGPYTFKAHGLTSVLERADKVKRLLAALSSILQNDMMAQTFLQQFGLDRVPEQILRGFGLDPNDFRRPPQPPMMAPAQMQQPMPSQAGGMPPPPPAPPPAPMMPPNPQPEGMVNGTA